MRLRVCQIIPTLVQGGAEKQMAFLASHLDRSEFDSHVIVLTHGGPLEEPLRDLGIPVHFINKRGKLDFGALRRLQSKLADLGPDVVQTWLFAANSYGRLAAARAEIPVIIASERCVDPWKRWWHHAIDKYLLKYTDKLTTNSGGVVDFYSHHGISADNFEIIANAVSTDTQPQLARDEFFQRLDIPPRAKVVGAVGRLWKQKGYEDLIWAAELLRVAHEDVWFVILGDGPERNRLQHFRDRVEAQHAVRFLGHRKDAKELMSCFDLLWNGSLYEGQSNTILEAMSMGIPVIASDIPGNRDLVQNDRTGHLYPLGDVETLTRKTLALLKDETRLQQYRKNSLQRVEQDFSLERMTSSYSYLYKTLYQSKTATNVK